MAVPAIGAVCGRLLRLHTKLRPDGPDRLRVLARATGPAPGYSERPRQPLHLVESLGKLREVPPEDALPKQVTAKVEQLY